MQGMVPAGDFVETQVKGMDLNHKYVAQGNSTTFRARAEHRVYDGRMR
jgi:hypothetical protein